MAEHEHGCPDITAHEKTFGGLTKGAIGITGPGLAGHIFLAIIDI